jgi:hypothetical protein
VGGDGTNASIMQVMLVGEGSLVPDETPGMAGSSSRFPAVPVISKLPSRATMDPVFLLRSTFNTTTLVDQEPPYDVVGRMMVFSGWYRPPGSSIPWSFQTMGVFGLNPSVSGYFGGQLCALCSARRPPAHSTDTIYTWDAVDMLGAVILCYSFVVCGF